VGNLFTFGGSGGNGGTATVTVRRAPTFVDAFADPAGGRGFYGDGVDLFSAGSVTAGSIVTFGGSGGNGGTATTNVTAGSGATVFASAFAEGGSATVDCCAFTTSGGQVFIESGGSIVTGPILSVGGAGGSGGTASVSVTGPASFVSAQANARGGDAFYGGGRVILVASGDVFTPIIASLSGSGGSGGSASVTVNGATGSTFGVANANGGHGNSSFFYGGGLAGLVEIIAGGAVVAGPIFTLGGPGGSAGTASVNSDVAGASLDLFSSGGDGGSGGLVFISAGSNIATGDILADGGIGGNASSGSAVSPVTVFREAGGGHGGHGGDVFMSSYGGSIFTGIVSTPGALAGAGGAGGGDGGIGGDGGLVSMSAFSGLIEVGPAATPGTFRDVIFTSGGGGGAGGAAASPAGVGGAGGHAGEVFLDAMAIRINGVIVAIGGAGGAGGAGNATEPAGSGGTGGLGGFLSFSTLDGMGTITFVNGGWSIDGGAGGSPGGSAGSPGLLLFLDSSNAALDLPFFVPTESQGPFTTLGGILSFEVLGASAINPCDLAPDACKPPDFNRVPEQPAEPGEPEEDEDRKKARMAVCRPRT